MDKLKQSGAKMAAIASVMRGADESNFKALAFHLDELAREHARAIGLPDDEIAKIEQEVEREIWSGRDDLEPENSLKERFTTVIRELLDEGEPPTDIARAWLAGGRELVVNVADENFCLDMADLIEPVAAAWRNEAKMLEDDGD
jgi:hypothetical protein